MLNKKVILKTSGNLAWITGKTGIVIDEDNTYVWVKVTFENGEWDEWKLNKNEVELIKEAKIKKEKIKKKRFVIKSSWSIGVESSWTDEKDKEHPIWYIWDNINNQTYENDVFNERSQAKNYADKLNSNE